MNGHRTAEGLTVMISISDCRQALVVQPALRSAVRRLLNSRSLLALAIVLVVVLSQPEYPDHVLFLLATLCWYSSQSPLAWAFLTTLAAWNHQRFPEAVDSRAMILLITSTVGLTTGWRNLTSGRGRAFTFGRLLTVAVICFYDDYYASAEIAFAGGIWCLIIGSYFWPTASDGQTEPTDPPAASRSAR
jgi:hypothetical protein